MKATRSTRRFNVLLVEDNPGDIRLAREALAQLGMPVDLEIKTSGAEALAYLHREGDYRGAPRPDLVLLDLNLPQMDGRVMLEIMRQDAVLQPIPVVVLTASRSMDDISSLYKASANCFFTKPMNYDDYVQVLEHILNYWLPLSQTACGDDS